MFRNDQDRWRRLVAVIPLAAVLLIAACAAPATPVQPATPAIPEVTFEVSDTAVTAPAEVPAGLVAVMVENSGQAPHGPIFARLNEGATLGQFMQALQEDESGASAIALVTLLGGGQAMPGESLRQVFDLEAGNYIALDFGEGPTEGPPLMTDFTVAGEGSAATSPAAAVNADLLDFAFALPDQVKAGEQTWKIENKGGQWHEMAIFKLNEGVTVADLMAMMSQEEPPEGPPPFEQIAFWAPMSAGEKAWITLDLNPGEYTVMCFLPDFASDPPVSHLEHGMVRTLTVTE